MLDPYAFAAAIAAAVSLLSPAPAPAPHVPEPTEVLSPAPYVPAPAPVAEDDYPLACTQSSTCSPMHALIPSDPHGDHYAVDTLTGEIFYLTLSHGYVSTDQCAHFSPCYDGTNGPYLPEVPRD